MLYAAKTFFETSRFFNFLENFIFFLNLSIFEKWLVKNDPFLKVTAYLSKTFSNSATENLKTVLHLSTAPSLSFSHPFNQSLSLPLSFFLSSLHLSFFPFLVLVLSQIIFSLSLSLTLFCSVCPCFCSL